MIPSSTVVLNRMGCPRNRWLQAIRYFFISSLTIPSLAIGMDAFFIGALAITSLFMPCFVIGAAAFLVGDCGETEDRPFVAAVREAKDAMGDYSIEIDWVKKEDFKLRCNGELKYLLPR